MERIATDTLSFADLRQGGFVYVDKTGLLLPLADGSVGVPLVGAAFDAEMRNLADRKITVLA